MAGFFSDQFELFHYNERIWATLDSIVCFLKQDKNIDSRPSQVEKRFKTSHDDQKLQNIDGKKSVPFKALVRFVFRYAESSASCNLIADHLIAQLVGSHTVSPHRKWPCSIQLESPCTSPSISVNAVPPLH